MKQALTTSLISALIVLLCACGASEDRYQDRWNSEEPDYWAIAKTLGTHKVRGCGEFYYKKNLDYSEYYVKCSPDGKTWTYYQVWPKQNKVYSAPAIQ